MNEHNYYEFKHGLFDYYVRDDDIKDLKLEIEEMECFVFDKPDSDFWQKREEMYNTLVKDVIDWTLEYFDIPRYSATELYIKSTDESLEALERYNDLKQFENTYDFREEQ